MAITNLMQFNALCWKDDAALYFPDGQVRALSCEHINEGNWGVNIRGVSFPIPTTTNSPINSSPPEPDQFQAQTVMVQAGNVYDGATPFPVGADYKLCVKTKDPRTGIATYVDAASYATNVVTCNPSDE